MSNKFVLTSVLSSIGIMSLLLLEPVNGQQLNDTTHEILVLPCLDNEFNDPLLGNHWISPEEKYGNHFNDLSIQEIEEITDTLNIASRNSLLNQDNYAIQEISPMDNDSSLRAFLPLFEEGINRFINGDSSLWKQNISQSEDVTIMGAWGAFEKGRKEVDARYNWAAARFKKSQAKVQIEYLSINTSSDLACTVTIERSEVSVINEKEPLIMALRVTHIFSKENGSWKLLHRHADPLMSKTAPSSVMQK